MGKTYVCDECGETCTTDWSDEEAHAERERNFPGIPMGQMAQVCDVCFKRIMAKHDHEIP